MRLQGIALLFIRIRHTKEDIEVKIQKCNKVQGTSKINSGERNSSETNLRLHIIISKTTPRFVSEVCILNGRCAEI